MSQSDIKLGQREITYAIMVFNASLLDDNRVISLMINKKSALSASSACKNITHADFADYADCQLIYLCSSVSLRLTKTDIHPLKSMGRCPGACLPLLSYKSKLLTPKP